MLSTKKLIYLITINLLILGLIEFLIMKYILHLENNNIIPVIDGLLLPFVSFPFLYYFGWKYLINTNSENKQLKIMFNEINNILFLMDVIRKDDQISFRCAQVNDAYLELTGLEFQGVVGKYIDDVLPPDSARFILEKYGDVINRRTPLKYEENVEIGNKKIVVETTLIPILKNNECVQLLGVAYDLTQHIQEKEKLEKLSTLDGLTNIPNRRYFDDVFEREWKNSIRYKEPISLILLDIDYFKKFNDTYGHLEGDECIKKVANTVKGVLNRPKDFLARYGGEEFVIVLPNTDLPGSTLVAEKIRAAIEDLKIKHISSDVSEWVTISLGVVSVIPEFKQNQNQFIQLTDQALYKAKENGRNQVGIINKEKQIIIN